MDLHPYMVEAIYLRQHPEDRIVKDTGIVIWFCPLTSKYLWKYSVTSSKHKNRPNIYEAKGLANWWNRYLKMVEDNSFINQDEGDLPY